jgi:hypothetical protein
MLIRLSENLWINPDHVAAIVTGTGPVRSLHRPAGMILSGGGPGPSVNLSVTDLLDLSDQLPEDDPLTREPVGPWWLARYLNTRTAQEEL